MPAELANIRIYLDHDGFCHVEALTGPAFHTVNVEERMNFHTLLRVTEKDLRVKLNGDRDDMGITASFENIKRSACARKEET